jgi:hypothetical protein
VCLCVSVCVYVCVCVCVCVRVCVCMSGRRCASLEREGGYSLFLADPTYNVAEREHTSNTQICHCHALLSAPAPVIEHGE